MIRFALRADIRFYAEDIDAAMRALAEYFSLDPDNGPEGKVDFIGTVDVHPDDSEPEYRGALVVGST